MRAEAAHGHAGSGQKEREVGGSAKEKSSVEALAAVCRAEKTSDVHEPPKATKRPFLATTIIRRLRPSWYEQRETMPAVCH